MNLATQIKKLEQVAGKGKWCALCRLILRSSAPVASAFASTRNAPGQVKKTCRFCGNQYHSQLPQGDEPKDRALCLFNSYDEEDFYTDEKACAVGAWLRHSSNRSFEDSERRAKRRQAARERPHNTKPTPEQKLRQRLTAEAGELMRGWHKEMKAKHGDPFPHIFELEEKIAFDFYKWRAASDELERWHAWAALERIIFDAPLPETTARIAEYEEKAAAEAAEKERQEAERREREQRTYSTNANHRPQPSGQWG
jgi:NTP pyrophosphatase (non-canonical NTP hydrolase)